MKKPHPVRTPLLMEMEKQIKRRNRLTDMKGRRKQREEKLAFLEHIKECANCRAAYEAYRESGKMPDPAESLKATILRALDPSNEATEREPSKVFH